VDAPHLDAQGRAALARRIGRRIGELYPELDPEGGLFPWFRNPFVRPLTEDPRLLVLGSTCGRFWALLIAGGVELHPVDGHDGEDPLRVLRDSRLVVPRGVTENQPPAAALGPGGRTLLLGAAGGESDASDRLVHLFSLAGDGLVRSWNCGARVTAVTLSPGGGMGAIGTNSGRVATLRLLTQREADRPVLRPAATPEPVAKAGDDLLERGDAPEDPEDLALLRRLTASLFEHPPRACHMDSDRLWVYLGRVPAQYTRGLPAKERPVYRAIRHLDLERGLWGAFPYLLHGDGTCHAYQLETRWLVLSHLRASPAPEDERLPPLPPKARGRFPDKNEFRRQLDLEVRDRWPAPAGPLVAVRVKDRPQEVWLVHGKDPALHQHLELSAPVRHLAWSPGGTRLAITLDDHQVWLYGTQP
jgi:hypothetical protein